MRNFSSWHDDHVVQKWKLPQLHGWYKKQQSSLSLWEDYKTRIEIFEQPNMHSNWACEFWLYWCNVTNAKKRSLRIFICLLDRHPIGLPVTARASRRHWVPELIDGATRFPLGYALLARVARCGEAFGGVRLRVTRVETRPTHWRRHHCQVSWPPNNRRITWATLILRLNGGAKVLLPNRHAPGRCDAASWKSDHGTRTILAHLQLASIVGAGALFIRARCLTRIKGWRATGPTFATFVNARSRWTRWLYRWNLEISKAALIY